MTKQDPLVNSFRVVDFISHPIVVMFAVMFVAGFLVGYLVGAF